MKLDFKHGQFNCKRNDFPIANIVKLNSNRNTRFLESAGEQPIGVNKNIERG